MEYLSEELAILILLRLPVKALLRFKSVCKLWYSLIRSPKFITDHCEVTKIKNPYDDIIALFSTKTDGSDDFNVSILSHQTLEVVDTHQVLLDGTGTGTGFVGMEIVSSCNGVVCLHDSLNNVIVLWNPATRDTKVVPNYNLYDNTNHDRSLWYIGFGFDAKNNDYKVVRIRQFFDSYPFRNEIEVYSLKTGNWRLVASSGVVLMKNSSDWRLYVPKYFLDTYSDGMYSWLACRIEEGSQESFKEIISFDMSNDVFISTPLPNGSVKDWNSFCWKNRLTVLGGSLAVISAGFNDNGTEYCNIWVLGKYGVKESWIKRFTIPSFRTCEWPLGFWRNYTLFMEKHTKLVLLDLVTKQRTSSAPIPKDWKMVQVFSFKESLVSVQMNCKGNYESKLQSLQI